MKGLSILSITLMLFLAACGVTGSAQVPTSQLPDPAIYALRSPELPEVGADWQQTYAQMTEEQGYKWAYQAYQAYQPGSTISELDSAFAVNNDVILYEVDMSRQDLPLPPAALGNIQGVSWKPGTQLHRVGDKSAVWKTTVGDLLTPVWWLEFYKDHAYVRISLFGFPDQIAQVIIYGLADNVAARLPSSVDQLRSDAATLVPTQPPLISPATPAPSGESLATPASPGLSASASEQYIPVLMYTAPPGETGMVSFFDDTGSQLTDGVLGSDDILEYQGLGTAYEWVGWTDQTEPVTLTFTLADSTAISAVKIGLNRRDGLGIFVPSRITVNGVSFEPAADAIPNNQRADLTINGPFKGPLVTIVLSHRGRGWIMLDEVTFIPVK